MDTLSPTAPLFVTDEEELLEQLCELTADTNISPLIVPDLGDNCDMWHSSPIVLLDPLAASEASDAGYPHRKRVIVVTHEPPWEAVWAACTGIGAEYLVQLPHGAPWLREHILTILTTPKLSV